VKLGTALSEVRDRLLEDMSQYNLLQSIKNIYCPILFIYGSNDKLVALSETENYYNEAQEPKEVKIIEGANHWLLDDKVEVGSLMVDWIKKYL